MDIANQYSFVLISLAGILILLGVARILLHLRWRNVFISGALLGVIAVAGFFTLRPGASDVDTLDEAELILSNGNPTLLEFFSNYCAGCIGVRPAVDNLVSNIRDRYSDSFNVLRIDIHTAFGRTLRERYGFSFTPEFILLDGAGHEIWRSHGPPDFATLSLVAAS